MSFRTLRFGDRTISYDAGLNLAESEESRIRQNKLISVDPQYDDGGIGTSDDETNSNTSNVKPCDDDENENVTECDDADDSDDKSKSRRVIEPDMTALNRLLAFDEEEEDECDDDEDEEEETKTSPVTAASHSDESNRPKLKPSQNSGWHKTIARDLAKLTSPRSTLSPNGDSVTRHEALARRHSITLCESRRHRKASSTNSSPASSSGGASPKISLTSGPMSIQPEHLNLSPQHSIASSTETSSMTSSMTSSRSSPMRADECSLNVNSIRLNDREAEEEDTFENAKSGLKTLNLRLDEVAHIRAALTKAELEGIDGNLRNDIERGKVCFLCMKTRFGLFSRGQNCQMCKQLVCNRCQSKMRIPLEHFSTTPVFALSPSGNSNNSNNNNDDHKQQQQRSNFSGNDPTLKYPSLMTSSTSSACKDKKMALPDSLGLLMTNSLQSVGSAPNSPGLSRRSLQPGNGLPTVSGVVGFANNCSSNGFGPVSLPSTAAMITSNPYATLPKKNRRMSWMSPLDAEREKLEGVPLNVCNDCKDMVVQVIRVSRSARRLQVARSAFFSLSPDTFREQRS